MVYPILLILRMSVDLVHFDAQLALEVELLILTNMLAIKPMIQVCARYPYRMSSGRSRIRAIDDDGIY